MELDLPQGCDSVARQVLDRVSRIHSSLGVIFPRRFFSFFHALSSVYSLFVCLSRLFSSDFGYLALSAFASIARVKFSARRRNNNFLVGRFRAARARERFRGARSSKRENERRTTQNCKKQNRVTRDTAPGQASPREAPLAPHPLPDRARTNRARAANGAPRELPDRLDRLRYQHASSPPARQNPRFLLPSTFRLPDDESRRHESAGVQSWSPGALSMILL